MEGTMGRLVLNPGTDRETACRSKGVGAIHAGDVLSIQLPGSGGYGPPAERDPEKVRWDVINGKVSRRSAEENYKVILTEGMEVDVPATDALRKNCGERG